MHGATQTICRVISHNPVGIEDGDHFHRRDLNESAHVELAEPALADDADAISFAVSRHGNMSTERRQRGSCRR